MSDISYSVRLLRREIIKQKQHLEVFAIRSDRGSCKATINDLEKAIEILNQANE